MSYKRKLSFGKVQFKDLQRVVAIEEKIKDTVFSEWFDFAYSITPAEDQFLTDLIESNRRFMDSYLEEELKARFIIPLINKVNFFSNGIRDWYERPLKAVINHVLFHGITDYMVAKGIETPEAPYFFIQEYKKAFGENHPKNPLLAEMMVALEVNQEKVMRGAYIIGRDWYFVILHKLTEHQYEYFLSKDFSSLKINELQGIYINLQAIKTMCGA